MVCADRMARADRELEGKNSGIPHLAKNERDVGHPSFVAGAGKAMFLDGSLQLAAGGVDVSATRPAKKGGNAARNESLLKGRDLMRLRHRIANPRTGIPGDKVH